MSHQYVAVQWNRQKLVYDLLLWFGIAAYIALFVIVTNMLFSGVNALSPMIVLIRAFATCAFVMLSCILCIGPLARLDTRFLALLYNRRHFGVSMFLVATTHAVLVVIWYHSFGEVSPIESLFASPGSFDSLANLPYQQVGVVALALIALLAATSHDFWNTNLGPGLWKAIHMSVYVAYTLIVLHVVAGAMQSPDTGVLPWFVMTSVLIVGGLHIIAAWRSREASQPASDWVDAGDWRDIADGSAKTITVGSGERIAVFRYDDNHIAAVGNVCRHQGGPLGEGRVIDGCITCPWHGFQYRPEDGCSPPPFTEKIPTFEVRVEQDRVLVNPVALPPGTARNVAVVARPG